MTIYEGWSPSPELDERIKLANDLSDAAASYYSMKRHMDKNMITGFYLRHPKLLHLDNLALEERIIVLKQAADRIDDYEATGTIVVGE